MSRSVICAVCRIALPLSLSALSLFCVDIPIDPGPDSYGMIELRARVVNRALSKGYAEGGSAQTLADTIAVEVKGGGLEPTVIKRRLDFSRPSIVDTITGVPVGKGQEVRIWAIGKGRTITHIDSVEFRLVNIVSGEATPVSATLIPAAGSIYLQIVGLGTDVSAVYASFSSLNDEVISESRVNRAARTFLNLDNIPHEALGILKVSILNAASDTMQVATERMKFNARGDNTIELRFVENSGMLKVEAEIYVAGVTNAAYNFKNAESKVEETGEVIITEIMWSAGNDNYLEIYNPKDAEIFFDTLTIDVDGAISGGTVYNIPNVTIAPKAYYVIGRSAMLYANYSVSKPSELPIGATGNWIAVKRGRGGDIMDRVICGGNNAASGWPGVGSSKRSVELDRNKYNVVDNNYGKNWSAATELIAGQTVYYGTPGR